MIGPPIRHTFRDAFSTPSCYHHHHQNILGRSSCKLKHDDSKQARPHQRCQTLLGIPPPSPPWWIPSRVPIASRASYLVYCWLSISGDNLIAGSTTPSPGIPPLAKQPCCDSGTVIASLVRATAMSRPSPWMGVSPKTNLCCAAENPTPLRPAKRQHRIG